MTTIIKAAGWVAIDKHGIAIQAIGATEEDALATALRDAGPLFDAEGNDLPEAEALTQFRAMPATAELIADVEARGGAICWDEVDGVACVPADEEDA